MIITDIASDADDILATVQVINVLRHRQQPARIAFVLSMLNPDDKAIFVKYLMSLIDLKGLDLDIEIYVAKGFNSLEEATEIHPNFPPRFGPVYDQLQGIDKDSVDRSRIFPVEQLTNFTNKCSDHSIHLLVLSPISMVKFIDFNKINLETAHMMGGIAIRNGVKKMGYNVGVSPDGFVHLCQQTEGKLIIVTPSTCDSTRMAVNFSKVKDLIHLDGVGNFIFDSLMRWHLYITKRQTNFLEVDTPCISDLVAADVFLRKVFPSYNSILGDLIKEAVETRADGVPSLEVPVTYQPGTFSINLNYKKSYLDDVDGEMFEAKDNATVVHFQEAQLDFSTVSQTTYGTYLVASVFTH
jgi:hypothetical protein